VDFSNPFFRYANKYWLHHAQKLNQQMYFDLEGRIQQLFDEPNIDQFQGWTLASDPLPSRYGRRRFIVYPAVEERFFYASLVGFPAEPSLQMVAT
jgi:hypothetical protein